MSQPSRAMPTHKPANPRSASFQFLLWEVVSVETSVIKSLAGQQQVQNVCCKYPAAVVTETPPLKVLILCWNTALTSSAGEVRGHRSPEESADKPAALSVSSGPVLQSWTSLASRRLPPSLSCRGSSFGLQAAAVRPGGPNDGTWDLSQLISLSPDLEETGRNLKTRKF